MAKPSMKKKETEKKCSSKISELNPMYKKSFWISLLIINIAFLFHTTNFMFGDHDWNYVRAANYWSEGAFEGRPLHFVLQSIFFGGHVLPILNNLFCFIALTLSGMILSYYWKIPQTIGNVILFTVFVATLPLTMVWLFYAKDSLINLSLPLIAISGLWLAERNGSVKNIYKHIGAIFLFYFAFASYAAIINLLGVVFLGGVLIAYINGLALSNLIKQKLPVVIDIIIAIILFKITLMISSLSSDYNTVMVPFDILPEKLAATVKVMFTQFVTPIPFMEYKYKILLLLISLLGFIAAVAKGGISKLPLSLCVLITILFASKLAFFIADERGQILAEMENFAFVPRLDFYGLAYVYALGVALTITYLNNKFYKIGYILIIIATFMSCVRDMYTQKVWKLGFDAEMKAHERIVSRLEQHKDFRSGAKYRLLQIGSLSLRKNYYREVKGEQISLDLLETSFTPQYMSRIVYNFYYPEDIFYDNATVADLSEAGRNYLKYQAKSWPSLDSLFIDGNIVVIVLTDDGLYKAKEKL